MFDESSCRTFFLSMSMYIVNKALVGTVSPSSLFKTKSDHTLGISSAWHTFPDAAEHPCILTTTSSCRNETPRAFDPKAKNEKRDAERYERLKT